MRLGEHISRLWQVDPVIQEGHAAAHERRYGHRPGAACTPACGAPADEPACARCGDAGFVRPAGLRPGDAGFGQAAPCPACAVEDEPRARLGRILRASGLAEHELRTYRPEGVTAPHGPAVEAWVQRRPLPWLVLEGPPGVGKTGAAVVALLGCARAGQRVRYEWVPDLVDRLRFEEMGGHDGDSDGASSRPVMARATAAGVVLLLDDLGRERLTPFGTEKIAQIVERRLRASAPTVITTSVGPGDRDGDPTWSRVFGPRSLVLRITGPDRRRGALA